MNSVEAHRLAQRKWAVKNKAYIQNWKKENHERILASRRPGYKQERLRWKEHTKAERLNNTEVINKAKDKPCMDCGVKYDPFIMHFDHRNPLTKTKSISQMRTHSMARIQEEIAKCDVVCANCHGIRTCNGIKTGKIKTFGRYHVNNCL